jgi:lipopolysaccharide export system protein LptA
MVTRAHGATGAWLAAGVMAASVLVATAVAAQQGENPFGGFRHDNTQPIEITADALEVRDAESRAIFSGDVVAGQGDLRLTADTVSVWYDREGDDTAAGDGANTGRIRRLRAEGDVFLSSAGESATGAWAEYAVTEAVVTMGGGVTLAQGENAISGERLRIDLETGVGRIEGGRVRTVFNPAEPD